MWLNCKVIRKWQPSHFYMNPPFSGLSPLSSKKFCTPPPSDSIFGRSYPSPLIRAGGGAGGGSNYVFYKKGSVKRFSKFAAKNLCRSLFLLKLLKRDFGADVFLWILRNSQQHFFVENLRRATSVFLDDWMPFSSMPEKTMLHSR